MIKRDENIFKLSMLAAKKERFQQGMKTARDCGDYIWLREKQDTEHELEEQMSFLRKDMTERDLMFASQLTNASIY